MIVLTFMMVGKWYIAFSRLELSGEIALKNNHYYYYYYYSRLFSRFFLRRAWHFKAHRMRQILAKIVKIYSDFGGRLICRSSYACRYTVLLHNVNI